MTEVERELVGSGGLGGRASGGEEKGVWEVEGRGKWSMCVSVVGSMCGK